MFLDSAQSIDITPLFWSILSKYSRTFLVSYGPSLETKFLSLLKKPLAHNGQMLNSFTYIMSPNALLFAYSANSLTFPTFFAISVSVYSLWTTM